MSIILRNDRAAGGQGLSPCTLLLGIALVLAQPVAVQAATRADTALDREVIAEMNFARTRPQAYIARLNAYRPTIRGGYAYETIKGPNGPYTRGTRLAEGTGAVDGAIRFLQRQRPIRPLAADAALLEAAQRFADEQARTARWGHVSADGKSLDDRIARDRTRHINNAETIMYGSTTAADIVMHLIIDDGVRDRSHRDVIFDPALGLVGTVCRRHPKWNICVSEYSSPERAR